MMISSGEKTIDWLDESTLNEKETNKNVYESDQATGIIKINQAPIVDFEGFETAPL
jgi:hypothetical protein